MLKARFRGIRTRILVIALVPSLLLICVGVGTSIYLFNDGRHAEDFARTLDGHLPPTRELVLAVEQERLLSVSQLAGEVIDPGALAAARMRFDSTLKSLESHRSRVATCGRQHVGRCGDGLRPVEGSVTGAAQ